MSQIQPSSIYAVCLKWQHLLPCSLEVRTNHSRCGMIRQVAWTMDSSNHKHTGCQQMQTSIHQTSSTCYIQETETSRKEWEKLRTSLWCTYCLGSGQLVPLYCCGAMTWPERCMRAKTPQVTIFLCLGKLRCEPEISILVSPLSLIGIPLHPLTKPSTLYLIMIRMGLLSFGPSSIIDWGGGGKATKAVALGTHWVGCTKIVAVISIAAVYVAQCVMAALGTELACCTPVWIHFFS